jgi:hypothetical protein
VSCSYRRAMHHIYTDEELLRRLKRSNGLAAWAALREFKRLIAKREVELLMSARRAEVPWLVIATHLGISPQAVQQRWKRLMAKEEADFEWPDESETTTPTD